MSDNNNNDYYSAIGEFLNKNLTAEEDPFEQVKSRSSSRYRKMGNVMERRPAPKINYEDKKNNDDGYKHPEEKLIPVPKDLVEDFAILQLLPGSSLDLCKSSWRRLLKKFHPDTVSNKKNITVEEAATVFRRVNNAYKRIEYWFDTGKILKID